MRLQLNTTLLYLQTISLAAAAARSDSFLGRTSEHIARAHRVALAHSAGLARDLRVAFSGLTPLVRRDAQKVLPAGNKIYCTVPKSTSPASTGLNGNGTSSTRTATATATRTATSTRSASSGATTTTRSTTVTSATGSPTASPTQSSSWTVSNSYTGNQFFSDWDWFTSPDPTNGIVDYIDANAARSNNLAYVNNAGNFIMAVETTGTVSGNRKSVRITTKASYTGGVVIMDAIHMPTGCGTWPAFWSNGPNWPAGGEIDIVEGVHDYISNQATIHTLAGCTLASTNGMSGSLVGNTNCAALDTGNQGCGVRAADRVSFGAGFNNNGGGTYAMKWDNSGVAIYFWPTSQVPSDVGTDNIFPENWGTPSAFWPASTCDPFKFFNSHSAIFDTTLCGDWAGGVWNSGGIPGQEQSCAQRTGYSTCEAFVRANGASFSQAYWEVRYVKIYAPK